MTIAGCSRKKVHDETTGVVQEAVWGAFYCNLLVGQSGGHVTVAMRRKSVYYNHRQSIDQCHGGIAVKKVVRDDDLLVQSEKAAAFAVDAEDGLLGQRGGLVVADRPAEEHSPVFEASVVGERHLVDVVAAPDEEVAGHSMATGRSYSRHSRCRRRDPVCPFVAL